MSTGFTNSRSMENIISFDLYQKINSEIDYFYPMFYQKGRDNTQLSKTYSFNELGILAIFSRRPKTTQPYSNQVCFSINRNSYEQEIILKELNVPVLYATPLETDISRICYGCEVKWFEITEDINLNIEVEFYNKEQVTYNSEIITLDNFSIKDMIVKTYQNLSWAEIIEKIEMYDSLKKEKLFHDKSRFYSVFNNIQKPIFIIYKLKK